MITRTKYKPAEIEKKWQEQWETEGIYYAQDNSPEQKYYNLVMLPYPSGDLHIGHWYNYTGVDAHGRFMRMRGWNVSQPMGFDAFGLPAENAAIKHNIQPRVWTLDNIARMQAQLRTMGAGWDWPRQIISCLPDYYKWTEWLFLQFYKAGLAYRTKAPANWCPNCNTTLANEQVVNGACERCGTPVTRKEIDQWLFRITRYADELLDFSELDWPEKTVTMQRNWIGRSEGAEVRFVAEVDGERVEIPVFTTRPDTIFGVTFFVLAPEHPLVERITMPGQRAAVEAYIDQSRRETEIERMSTEKEKTGVFTGASITNPVSGEKVPVWIADYVLMSYGTGAVMGVPAHDERDFEFARKFGLPIRQVVCPPDEEPSDPATWTEAKSHYGVMINSGPFNGTQPEEAIKSITRYCEERGIGKYAVNYRLRDWLVSRQRYWGSPIPIIYCPTDGMVPVPEEDLPVLLPDEVQFKPTGESPLRYVSEFLNTTCPVCGGPATRETDTLDTFLCSSWYFLRYMDAKNDQAAWDKEKIAKWLPVDMYIGGAEHAVMHLLYARFFVKALRDMGLLNFNEPFKRLYHQGTVLGPDGQKMSKSRGNVIAPDDVVGRFGADAVRCYLMFMGPFDQGGTSNIQGIEGVWRYLNRVWNLVQDSAEAFSSAPIPDTEIGREIKRTTHKFIKRVTAYYEELHFNTALAGLMEFTNALMKARETEAVRTAEYRQALEALLLLLAPLAPHITEELWHGFGHAESIHRESWPTYDETLTQDAIVTVVVQISGKVRDKLEVEASASEDEVRARALASERVQKLLGGEAPKKVIYVPGKLINLVV
ncbi:MAG TPA: leucine--tRNA ligase [Ktedonobacterales bacterium]|nr:leucine--tRNA ligase [Ktedonobacterales bacterium]